MKRVLIAALLAAAPAAADDVTDTIESALQAYNEGDVAYAEEELTFAIQLLKQMKADSLSGFLPEAMDGWTREIDSDQAAGMQMMGGAAAAATYTSGNERFTITILVDSPMVMSMGAMVANPAMAAASGGELVRVGREKFVLQDNQMIGLVDNRALVQGEGSAKDAMKAHIETMDFEALSQFSG